jgi:hypothetical protein
MVDVDDVGNFFSRWSRRKLGKEEEARTPEAPPAPPVEGGATPAAEQTSPATAESAQVATSAEPLPPVESLTPSSDFKPFMQPDVSPDLRQAAMKQLFKDPHFNVMDGLDTYIDDYSQPDPIPEAMMKKMYQARELLFSPEEKAAAIAEDAAEEAAAQAELERKNEELQQAFSQPAEPTPAKDA